MTNTRKLLLIIGIIIIVAGILGVLLGTFFGFVGANTLDASTAFYDRQRIRMKVCLIAGSVVLIIGVVLLILRCKF